MRPVRALAGLALLATAAACGDEPAQNPPVNVVAEDTMSDPMLLANDTAPAPDETNTAPDAGNVADSLESNTTNTVEDAAQTNIDDILRDVHRPIPAPAVQPSRMVIFTPHGTPWPSSAGYLSGFDYLRADGLSTVTVDNSRNGDNVFVKLVALDGGPTPVRHVFIPGGGQFTMGSVSPGRYDVRYQILSDGSLFKTESFVATQTANDYSVFRLTLYKVPHGNMETTRIRSWDE